MKKFGLIGHPIAHSLSPALFHAGYGGKYSYGLIEGENFEESFKKFLDEYEGINVTAPFKEFACRKADILSPECKIIGAANVLKKTERGVIAYNTDHSGVTGARMEGACPSRKTKGNVLVVGCGGAAKAAVYSAVTNGDSVTIINRNFEKARDFAANIGNSRNCNVTARPLSDFCRCFRKADTIIYTLPVMISEISDLTQQDIKGTDTHNNEPKIIIEANYKDPAFTPDFINRITEINPEAVYVGGREWLLHQAVGAYLIFTGEEPNIEEMRKVL